VVFGKRERECFAWERETSGKSIVFLLRENRGAKKGNSSPRCLLCGKRCITEREKGEKTVLKGLLRVDGEQGSRRVGRGKKECNREESFFLFFDFFFDAVAIAVTTFYRDKRCKPPV